MTGTQILVINAGSSSIKAALFDDDLRQTLRIEASGIGQKGEVAISGGPGNAGTSQKRADLPTHAAALQAILKALEAAGIGAGDLRAAAHRVVHGGEGMTASARITPQVHAAIAAAAPLAPLHNPHNLAAIDALSALMPGLAQFASFDTAFHTTNPEVARRYALPQMPQTEGLQRYGFHGTSYAALVQGFAAATGQALPRRLLAMHLGNGASLCAILQGRSVATTMGFSPLGGLTMGTRAGNIDAGAVLHLAQTAGLKDAHDILHHRSGLFGLSGGLSSDMRTLAASDTKASRFARDHFCYWITRQAGSMIAAMQGLDGIAFTGGIGENDADIRTRILSGLAWAGDVPHWVIAAAEEQQIARDAAALLQDREDAR